MANKIEGLETGQTNAINLTKPFDGMEINGTV